MELKRLIEQYLTEERIDYTVDFYNTSFGMVAITFYTKHYGLETLIVDNISKSDLKRLYGEESYSLTIIEKNTEVPILVETSDELKILELIKEVVEREQD